YAAYGSGYKCVECEYVYGTEITEPSQGEGHTHEYINAVSKPDCLNPGYIISKCRICDHTVVCLIDANPHIEPDNWIDNGVNHVKYCTNDCGTIVVEEAHKYKAEHTTEGTINYVCEVCGNVYSDTIIESDEPSGCKHQYEPVLIEPTCEEPGTISYKCSICGSVKENSYGEIPALGHRYSDDDWTSCDVNQHGHYCLNGCGTRETEAHDFDESATITPNNNGTHNLTCKKCGTVIEECSVNVGDSTPSVVTCDKCQGLATRLATSPLQVGDKIVIAVNDGSDTTYMGEEFTAVGAEQATVYFTVEESEVEGEFYLSAVINGEKVYLTRDGDDLLYLTEPNEFSSWNITIDEDGNAQLQCGDTNRDLVGVDNGGGIYQFAVNVPDNDIEISIYHVNASGSHVHVDDVADCVCDICGNTHHTFSIDDIDITDPTCTEKGFTTHICACGKLSYIDSYVDAIGHSYDEVVTAPTCTENGYTTHTCSACNDKYTDAETTAIGHEWGEWVDSNDGVNCIRTCLNDSDHTETIAHDIQRYWQDPDTGITYHAEYCLRCNKLLTQGEDIAGTVEFLVATEYEMLAVLNTNSNILDCIVTLEDNITITNPIVVDSIVEIHLDGHTLAGTGKDDKGDVVVFIAEQGSDLWIFVEGGSIKAEGAEGEDAYVAEVNGGVISFASVGESGETEGGTISTTGDTLFVVNENGNLFIAQNTIDKFEAEEENATLISSSEKNTTINGGIFQDWDPSEYVDEMDMYHHNHVTYNEEDGTYTVVQYDMIVDHVVAPTCTEQGYTVFKCPKCSETIKDIYKDALEHSYQSDVTAPTCTEKGYTTYTCSRCLD
ncbi:MAG: hypothetical protein J6Q06_04425, partial [Clostridia bacterium]|nr:hypothetical protein [Clostridia bacterium]